MTLPASTTDKALRVYLALVQYPILSTSIRARMRRELFQRGVITQATFDAEVREQAIRSQQREALNNPFSEEPPDVWEMRLMRVRDHLTDFYFAYNLPYEIFEDIVRQALAERGVQSRDMLVSFNAELAPQDMLFEQGYAIEKMPAEERKQLEHRLMEIKVVLIRTLISDQLAYVNIAKEWFTMADLSDIRWRKVGGGKIGGKSAGMLLAARIIHSVAGDEIRQHLTIPESFFIGSDTTFRFTSLNNLSHWSDQKYKSEDQIRAEYPLIQEQFLKSEFPPDTVESLRELLGRIGHKAIIVRSSSLLEDNFGTSFAGKYESHFLPNQRSLEENLQALMRAIKRIYASVFNPDALSYRRSKELQDYNERMAILLQVVQGEKVGKYFFPHAAGVAFSHNQFRWSPQIRRDDGFMRLVWGLGTRAVDRVGNDYPRLVALSHPLLHPAAAPKDIRRYSQHYIDLIDLEKNEFVTLPAQEVLTARYPVLRYIAQADDGGYLRPIRSAILDQGTENLVLTFEEMLRRTPFAGRMRDMLQVLEKEYRSPVDTEFTVEILNPYSTNPEVQICLLQCRPQSHYKESKTVFPESLNPVDVIFATHRVVPDGAVDRIRYVVFAVPEGYYSLPTEAARRELARTIGMLNSKMEGQVFICVGPGRWGTSTPDLGVPIGYADIYNTRALVELSGEGVGTAPEPSYGTHFFQDLVEAQIYPLAILLDDSTSVFKHDFFYEAHNCIGRFLPEANNPDWQFKDSLRVIDVQEYRPGWMLNLVMDDDKSRAAAFLLPV